MLSFESKDFANLRTIEDEKIASELHQIKLDLLEKLNGYKVSDVIGFFSKIILSDLLNSARIDSSLTSDLRNIYSFSRVKSESLEKNSDNSE